MSLFRTLAMLYCEPEAHEGEHEAMKIAE